MTTLDSVREMLSHILKTQDALTFAPEQGLLGVLPSVDSLTVYEIIVDLHPRFGFRPADDDISAEDFLTVQTLCDYIDARKK